MEKKSQVLNLRKPEPEIKPQAPEETVAKPSHRSASENVLSLRSAASPAPLLVSPSKDFVPSQQRNITGPVQEEDRSSWGFVIKQKPLRGKKLFLVLAGIILIGAFVWFTNPNIPLLMVIGLATVVVMVKAYVPTKDTEVVFNDRGIRINEAFYSSATLASFHIDETEVEFPELSFEIKQRLMPRVRIPIPVHLTSKVRDSLVMLALETEHEPSMGEIIGKKLRL